MKKFAIALAGLMALGMMAFSAVAAPLGGAAAGLKGDVAAVRESEGMTQINYRSRRHCRWHNGHRHCWWSRAYAPSYAYNYRYRPYYYSRPSIYLGWGGWGWGNRHHHHRHHHHRRWR